MLSFLQRHSKAIIILLPLAWLGAFFLVPLIELFQVSFTEARRGIPPFQPLWGFDDDRFFTFFSFDNYRLLYDYAPEYLIPAVNSLRLAGLSTLFCLLFAFPIAWLIARSTPRLRAILLVMVLLPFWTSSLIRIYALIGLLSPTGYINAMLMALGVIDQPVQMLQTDFAIYMGMLLTYLPLMILPLYATLVQLEDAQIEAAADLGARGLQIFLTVILPHSIPGIVAGCFLVFIPAVGEFVIPALLGGPDQVMLGRVLWNEFFRARDWPVAAAIAMILLMIIALPIIFARYHEGIERGKN